MEKLLDISTIANRSHCMHSDQCHSGCTLEMCNSVKQYIESFTPKEMQAYLIAKSHLGSSFSLYKSVGFLQWKKKNGL
jgi:hypothetical protein